MEQINVDSDSCRSVEREVGVIRYIGRHLLTLIPMVFIVSTLAFVLVQLVPGDPATYILGETSTPEKIAEINARLGLDRPLAEQYFSWLASAIRGDMGASFITNVPVTQTIGQTIESTLSIAVLATIVMLVMGMFLGMLSAIRGGALDTFLQSISSFFLAVPNFWLAPLLVLVFAIGLHWFPAVGYTPFGVSPTAWATGLVIPVVAVASSYIAQVALHARSSVLDVISRDFVRTLQAAGVPRRRILYKHVLRNAAIPVVTIGGLNFTSMLSGVIVVEVLFNIPGMGSLMVNSVYRHDLPILQATVIYFAIVVMVVNLAVDLLAAWLDPRIRVR